MADALIIMGNAVSKAITQRIVGFAPSVIHLLDAFAHRSSAHLYGDRTAYGGRPGIGGKHWPVCPYSSTTSVTPPLTANFMACVALILVNGRTLLRGIIYTLPATEYAMGTYTAT